MATNAKRKNLEHLDPSEVEVMRDKIRKLEATLETTQTTVKAKDKKEKELMSKIEELQMFKYDQVDYETDETQANEVLDILFVFMENNGFKGIAFKIFSYLDCGSFVQCRQVCRPWKNFIDNEWSMLQLQIFHLKRPINKIRARNIFELNPLGPIIKIMEKSTNKSKLRAFINMCQELASRRCRKLLEQPLQYMIDHHRHQELEILIDYPIQKTISNYFRGYGEILRSNVSYHFTTIFKYACQYGCKICVKLLLERSEEMEIDFNSVKIKERDYDHYQYRHCLHVARCNDEGIHYGLFRKEVLDLLLRNAEEKGIDVNFKDQRYGTTLRDDIISEFEVDMDAEIEDYTEETYKILNIDPSVDLKRSQ